MMFPIPLTTLSETCALWMAQGDTIYYKNPRMLEMDDGIGDIQAKIADDQARQKPSRGDKAFHAVLHESRIMSN